MAEAARDEVSLMLDELNTAKKLCKDQEALLVEQTRELHEVRAAGKAAIQAAGGADQDGAQQGSTSKLVAVVEEKRDKADEEADSWGDDDWGNDDEDSSSNKAKPLSESQNTMSSATDVCASQNASSGASSGEELGDSTSEADMHAAALVATEKKHAAAVAAAEEAAETHTKALQAAAERNEMLDTRQQELEEEVQQAKDSFEVSLLSYLYGVCFTYTRACNVG